MTVIVPLPTSAPNPGPAASYVPADSLPAAATGAGPQAPASSSAALTATPRALDPAASALTAELRTAVPLLSSPADQGATSASASAALDVQVHASADQGPAPRVYDLQGAGLMGRLTMTSQADGQVELTLRYTERETRREDGAPFDPRAGDYIPLSTYELHGVARPAADGSLTLPFTRALAEQYPDRVFRSTLGFSSFQPRRTGTLTLRPDGAGGLTTQLDGQAVSLKPLAGPTQLTRAFVTQYYALPGAVVDARLQEVNTDAAGKGAPTGTLKDTVRNWAMDKLRSYESTGHYTYLEGELTVEEGGQRHPIRFFHYAAQGAGPRTPLVTIMPILNGEYALERLIALYLARHGISTVVVERLDQWLRPERDLHQLEQVLRGTVLDQRYVLDWLGQQPWIDRERTGAAGFCTGGMGSVVLRGVEPAIKSTYTALAAGRMGSLLAESPLVSGYRNARLAEYGSLEALRAAADELLVTDPIRMSGLGSGPLKMVIANADYHVPAEHQYALWLAQGQPAAESIEAGHYNLALLGPGLPHILKDMAAHFNRTLPGR